MSGHLLDILACVVCGSFVFVIAYAIVEVVTR